MMNSSFILTITNIPHNSTKQQIDLINPHDVRLKIPFLKRFGKFKLQILASNELGEQKWFTVGVFRIELSAILARDYINSLIYIGGSNHEIIEFYTDTDED